MKYVYAPMLLLMNLQNTLLFTASSSLYVLMLSMDVLSSSKYWVCKKKGGHPLSPDNTITFSFLLPVSMTDNYESPLEVPPAIAVSAGVSSDHPDRTVYKLLYTQTVSCCFSSFRPSFLMFIAAL